MQFEGVTRCLQRVSHGNHRCDTDTAAQQDRAPRIAGQRKQIAWCADLQLATFLQRIVHTERSAARGWVLEHAQPIDALIGGVAAQRVLAHQARFYVNVDMCTGFEQRQRCTVTTGQIQDDNAVPLQLALVHDYIQQLFSHGHDSMEFVKVAVATR